MEFQEQLVLVKEELMKYDMCSDINKLIKLFYQNNNNFGKDSKGMLLHLFTFQMPILTAKKNKKA